MQTNKLVRFLALVFVAGWLCQGLAIWYGVNGSGRTWLFAAMWAPMLAAVLTSGETRRRIWRGIKRSGWKVWPLALIVGWSFSIGQQLLLWAGHQGSWHSDFFQLSRNGGSIESVHHLAMLLGPGHQSFGLFALNLVLSVTAGSLITMLIGGIGEEAGWRGFLQPELQRRFGLFKGTFLVGVIWGCWHLPVNLAGYNGVQHPILQAAILFQIGTIAMSFALAWLVGRTGSLWPAALAHGANNVLQSGMLMVPNGWWADQLTSIVAAVVVGMIFCWLLLRHKSRLQEENEPKLGPVGLDPLLPTSSPSPAIRF